MSEAVKVVIPGTPNKLLAPNKARTVHYLRKADVSREMRYRAAMAAASVVAGLDRPLMTDAVVMEITVFWGKGERSVDLSAIPSMTKPFEDGLTDAGIWGDDRQVRRLIVEQCRDPDGAGKVEIIVTDWEVWHWDRRQSA